MRAKLFHRWQIPMTRPTNAPITILMANHAHVLMSTTHAIRWHVAHVQFGGAHVCVWEIILIYDERRA